MKRSNYGVLFAVLLLALINLSPSNSMKNIAQEEDRDDQMIVPSREQAKDEGKIKVAVQMKHSEFVALQQMNQLFMQNHDFEVELINSELDPTYRKLQSQLELSEAPDVLLINNEWVRHFASQGFLLPTDRYYSGSLNGELLTSALAQNEWNGYMWGVPLDVDPYVLVYNSNALKKLGLTLPPTTQQGWNELIYNFLNQNQIPYLLSYDYNDPYASLTLLWQLTAEPTDGNKLFELTEAVKATFQQLESMRPILLDSEEQSSEKLWKLCYDEKLLFYLTRASEANGRNDKVISIYYPQQSDKPRSLWQHGRSYVVPTQSANAKKAGEWIAAMTSLQDQSRWFQASSHLPVNKSQYSKQLPSWVPSSIGSMKANLLPVYAELPNQMVQYGELTRDFMKSKMNVREYTKRMLKIIKF
ncbi:extracellular solute-binding protein [Paenibacillus turicensis]|uniref:ABC transporter substrate-binding protein n=1 Tax=Paenibacillus turicensis TaxID=160487 RepID=UPI003D2D1878